MSGRRDFRPRGKRPAVRGEMSDDDRDLYGDELHSGRPTSAPPSLELGLPGLFDMDGDSLVPPACVRARARVTRLSCA